MTIITPYHHLIVLPTMPAERKALFVQSTTKEPSFSSLRAAKSSRFAWLDETALKTSENNLSQVKQTAKTASLVATVVIAVFTALAVAAALAALLLIPGLNVLVLGGAGLALAFAGSAAILLINALYNKSRQERTLADQIQRELANPATLADADEKEPFQLIENHYKARYNQEFQAILEKDRGLQELLLDNLINPKPFPITLQLKMQEALQSLPPKTDEELLKEFAKSAYFLPEALLDPEAANALKEPLRRSYNQGLVYTAPQEWLDKMVELAPRITEIKAAFLKRFPQAENALPLIIEGLLQRSKTLDEMEQDPAVSQTVHEAYEAVLTTPSELLLKAFLEAFKTRGEPYKLKLTTESLVLQNRLAALTAAGEPLLKAFEDPMVRAILTPLIEIDKLTRSVTLAMAHDVLHGLSLNLDAKDALKPHLVDSFFDGSLHDGTAYDKPAIQTIIQDLRKRYAHERQTVWIVFRNYCSIIKQGHNVEALEHNADSTAALKGIFEANLEKGLGIGYALRHQRTQLNAIINAFKK